MGPTKIVQLCASHIDSIYRLHKQKQKIFSIDGILRGHAKKTGNQ